MVFELICLLVAFTGWIVLTTIYTDESGNLTAGHIVGAIIFIAACGLYFAMMMCNVACLYEFKTWSEYCVFGSAFIFFALSMIFGFVFVAGFFGEDISYGWMFEHASFVLLIGAHVLLFVVDTLLGSDTVEGGGWTRFYSLFNSVRINYADVRLS